MSAACGGHGAPEGAETAKIANTATYLSGEVANVFGEVANALAVLVIPWPLLAFRA